MPPRQPIPGNTIAQLRQLAAHAEAETYVPGWPYGGCGPAGWSENVAALLGGPTGDYCAAVHPALLVQLLDEIESLRAQLARAATTPLTARTTSPRPPQPGGRT